MMSGVGMLALLLRRYIMVYDLTSLLTTVSAGSASFIAIIGGLIATKLIDINNQRAAVDEEMEELAVI